MFKRDAATTLLSLQVQSGLKGFACGPNHLVPHRLLLLGTSSSSLFSVWIALMQLLAVMLAKVGDKLNTQMNIQADAIVDEFALVSYAAGT